MRISNEDIDKLYIISIFHGAAENWKTVYLELDTVSQADWILAHAGKLEKRYLSVGNHIPWQARERHEHFQAKAHVLRKEESMKTRIFIKGSDYILQFRAKGSNDIWNEWKGELDTPKIQESSHSAGPRLSPTKAKGRKLRVALKGIKRLLSPENDRREVTGKRSRTNSNMDDGEDVAEEIEEVFAEVNRSDKGIFSNTQFIGVVNERRASNIGEFNEETTIVSAAANKEVMTGRPQRNRTTK